MFNRRRSDIDVSFQGRDFVNRLRHLTIMLLRNFKTFSGTRKTEEAEQIQNMIDSFITKLQSVDSVEPLEELEIQIKKLIYTRKEIENLQTAQRLNALQGLIAAAASGLAELAGDSENFSVQLEELLKGLETFASREELTQFREQLGDHVLKMRTLVETKQKQEEKITTALRQRVEKLEEQLVAAHEELVIDALTQLYNRGAFDTRLRDNIKHYTTHGGSFSLILFDIDHFKMVNDVHGHPVGDRVLQAVAKTAKSVFRIDDFIARYGGEEFVVLLDDTRDLYALKAAERYRLAIAHKEFQYQQGGKTRSLTLTVSLGVASFKSGDTPECLVQRADQALYLAKNSGRNTVKTEDDLG